jgi:hypothetical protein
MDGGEKRRSADVLQQFDSEIRGHETDPHRAPCSLLATGTPPQNSAVAGRSGATQTVSTNTLGEARASPPSRAPALALRCHEADNLSEADRAPTHRIRSDSARRAGCPHLPRSAL